MIRKLPIIRPPVSSQELLASLAWSGRRQARRNLAGLLRQSYQAEDVLLTGSGLSAFYLILRALKEGSSRDEVVLPDYTAGSLAVAIAKAGLKPVLCDISLEDFNADSAAILRCLSGRTLAVLAVHMFGIPQKGIGALRGQLPPDVLLIEDCCQAMGSRVDDRPVGSFSHVSFHSFNRGKNLSLFGGGCVVSPDPAMAALVRRQEKLLKNTGVFSDAFLFFRMAAVLAAAQPPVYGLAHGLIRGFKENSVPEDFPVARMNCIQAGLGVEVFKRCREIFAARRNIGLKMLAGLQGIPGLKLPQVRENDFVCFNRLPVLFDRPERVAETQRSLWEAGIESSPMYLKPLHIMFGLPAGNLPNAGYLASRLLTLPVYPGLTGADIERICQVIRR